MKRRVFIVCALPAGGCLAQPERVEQRAAAAEYSHFAFGGEAPILIRTRAARAW